jgi:mevalonate kinase
LAKFRLYNSGTPAESTGAVVSAVCARGEQNPTRFQDLLQTMGRVTDTFGQALRQSQEEVETILSCMREFQRCLEELGVVPTTVVRKVRAIEAAGGAAKISGAGSLSGPGAGSLLVYHHEPEHLAGVEALASLEELAITLGGEGLRRD